MTEMEIRAEYERLKSMGYVTVHDLCRECLVELKRNYLVQLENEGMFAEVVGVNYDAPTYEDFAEADNIVHDDVIFEVYGETQFYPDDFFCLM